MFRPMLRSRQQLSREECEKLLIQERRGVLSLLGDQGYPYGVPINYYYNPEDGKLYFHSGMKGHKLDALRACGKASFCVYDRGEPVPDHWALNVRSVIVFGRLEILEDREQGYEMARRLSRKFTGDEDYIQQEIDRYGPATVVFTLTPEHISGKLVNES